MAAKHIPQRTCVGCYKVKPKREMVRLVRTPEDGVEVDPSGKKPGRGAYLCRDRTCWDLALAKGRLEYALNISLGDVVMASLTTYAQSLPEPVA